MKKILTIALALFLGFGAVAQDKSHKDKTPEEKARMMTEKMQEKLDLTKDQYNKVYQLNLETAKQMQQMREQRNEDKEANRAQMKQFRAEREAKLNAVLTAEQQQKLEAMKAERKKKHHGNDKHIQHKRHEGQQHKERAPDKEQERRTNGNR